MQCMELFGHDDPIALYPNMKLLACIKILVYLSFVNFKLCSSKNHFMFSWGNAILAHATAEVTPLNQNVSLLGYWHGHQDGTPTIKFCANMAPHIKLIIVYSMVNLGVMKIRLGHQWLWDMTFT